MKTCPKCGGAGCVHDDTELGAEMMALRISYGITLPQMAKNIGISKTHLCMLEHGKRHWKDDVLKKFQNYLQ